MKEPERVKPNLAADRSHIRDAGETDFPYLASDLMGAGSPEEAPVDTETKLRLISDRLVSKKGPKLVTENF